MKRFLYRKRPHAFNPPRAKSAYNNKTSGLPSRVVISATTLTYAALTVATWDGFKKGHYNVHTFLNITTG